MAGERTVVLGFKTEFNGDDAWSRDHVLNTVVVPGERGGKWPSELIADCLPSFHEQARNLKHYIFGVVRHNAVKVCSSPRVVVLIDERFDVSNRPASSRSDHLIPPLLVAFYTRRDERAPTQGAR